MKLGAICRADNSGLGVQTLEFYKHMRPDKTMVVDISRHNNNQQFPERYSDNAIGEVVFITDFPQPPDIDRFLEGLDVVFIAESAYSNYVYSRAKELGVRTAVQYNYEFFDWFNAEAQNIPDMFIAPSRWHYAEVDAYVKDYNVRNNTNIQHVYLHCPVNREQLPQREIKQARMFLHSGGKSAAYDRNGTDTVIESSKYLKTDAKIFIHFQGEQGLSHQATHLISHYREYLNQCGDPTKVVIQQWEYPNYEDVYSDSDVLILPRRYGGNCLPLNEALSVGMPVIMPDISPNRGFLPSSWLVPAEKIAEFTPRTTVGVYAADPKALAAKIDEFFEMTPREMEVENILAGNLAHSISWPTMKSQYLGALEALCNI